MSAPLNEQMLGGTVTALKPFGGTVMLKTSLGGSVVNIKPLSGTASLCP